jgi:glucosylceramidase
MSIKYIYSQENDYWKAGSVNMKSGNGDTLELSGEKKQDIRGFGGCFNELGYDVLKKLPVQEQEKILDDLFGADGLAFNMGRLPIGANDYSMEWYSCCETNSDYDLKDFNINRDKQYTIPYIREALKRQPDMELFASPWSPPTWMKTFPVYNYGRIKMEDKILKAYAKYFIRFIEEYQKEGVRIKQIHVQNEPMADQKFPSCLRNGEDMKLFIKASIYFISMIMITKDASSIEPK